MSFFHASSGITQAAAQFCVLGNTGGVVGYQETPIIGSLSSSNEIDGLRIERLFSGVGANKFQVVLNSNVDPLVTAFTSITIQIGDGSDETFLTSDLDGGSYFYIGGATDLAFWQWQADDTNRIWVIGDVGETKNFTWVG